MFDCFVATTCNIHDRPRKCSGQQELAQGKKPETCHHLSSLDKAGKGIASLCSEVI